MNMKLSFVVWKVSMMVFDNRVLQRKLGLNKRLETII
jgi:hypothetical protein